MPATTIDRSLRASRPGASLALDLTAPTALNLRLPTWLPALGLAVLSLSLLMLALQWRQPLLNQLQIEGRFERVAPEPIRQAAAAHLARGIFGVDLAATRRDVAALPWVARARVERIWPAGVRIRVWEREAYARWNGESLLDTTGAVFTPALQDQPESVVGALPHLGGTPGNEKLVIATYRQLSQALADGPLALAGLQLDARGEWTAQTRRGVELHLGPGDAADKLPVLTGALPTSLGERLSEVAYVDLRYTNGFAIGWLGRPGVVASGKTPAAAGGAGIQRSSTAVSGVVPHG